MALTPRQKRQFASEAQAIPALLQVGKNGITSSFIEELERMSKKRGLVKIKFLKSFLEADKEKTLKEQLEELAEQSKTELVQVIGNTASYYNPLAREAKNTFVRNK
jgi:RNA-binding protein